jgi:hypothetical protein
MANEAVSAITLLATPTKALRQNRFGILVAGGTVEESGAGADAVGIILENSPDSTVAGTSLAEASDGVSVAKLDGSIQQIVAGATVVSPNKVESDAEGRAGVAGGASLGVVLEGGDINELITIISTKAG